MKIESNLQRDRQFKRSEGTTIMFMPILLRGSTLLASARAGFLNTNALRARFEGGDGEREICEHDTETLYHVTM